MDINTYIKKVKEGTIEKKPQILTTKARVWVDPDKCPCDYSILDIEGKKYYIVYKSNKNKFDVVNGFFIRGHQKMITVLSVGIASEKLLREELESNSTLYQQMYDYSKNRSLPCPEWKRVEDTKSRLVDKNHAAHLLHGIDHSYTKSHDKFKIR